MSHRHDPVRVSRRTALGAAAAAGAASGSRQRAEAASSSSDAGGPTTDSDFVPEGTEIPEVSPSTDHDRHPLRQPRRDRLQADLQRRGHPRLRTRHFELSSDGREAGSRRRSCSPTAPGSPRWSSTRRIPTPTTPSSCASCATGPRWPTPAPSVGRRIGEHECCPALRHPCRSTRLCRRCDDRRRRRRGRVGVLRHRQRADGRRASSLGRQDRVRHGRRRPVLPDQPGPRLRLACDGSPNQACSVPTPVVSSW